MTTHKKGHIYIAGPMTGNADFNYPAFNAAAHLLRLDGWFVANPAELDCDNSQSWEYYMKKSIVLLLDCDTIMTLPGWRNSKGASLEVQIASTLRMTHLSYTYLENLAKGNPL